MRDLKELAQKLEEQIYACKTQVENHHRLKKQLELKRQRAHDAVERLEIELSNATPDDAAIDVLEEQLESAKEELERAKGVFEDVVLQRDKLNKENRINKNKLNEAQKAVDEHEYRVKKAQAQVRNFQSQREQALKDKNNAIDLVTGAQENRAEWEEARREKQEEIDEQIVGARRICPVRVEVPRGKSQAQLLEKWQRLVATRRQTETELGGSQNELLKQANQAKETHYKAMQELEHIKALRNVSQGLLIRYCSGLIGV